jgi:hypothetical protein
VSQLAAGEWVRGRGASSRIYGWRLRLLIERASVISKIECLWEWRGIQTGSRFKSASDYQSTTTNSQFLRTQRESPRKTSVTDSLCGPNPRRKPSTRSLAGSPSNFRFLTTASNGIGCSTRLSTARAILLTYENAKEWLFRIPTRFLPTRSLAFF